ncbi:hypothetical protein PQR39_24860, partial [Paraburkholderia sediminicola]|uniref:hypothetical protein n=1 Tax=Paraburkholderia sediminicola TaxID=458836 RepID=UPI0038BAC3F8
MFDSGGVNPGNELVGIIESHNFKVNPTTARMSIRLPTCTASNCLFMHKAGGPEHILCSFGIHKR